MKLTTQTSNTITIVFAGLSAFVVLCSLLLLLRVLQPPGPFRRMESTLPPIQVLPSDTPTPIPTATIPPSWTPQPQPGGPAPTPTAAG